jgi:hypothetical protein
VKDPSARDQSGCISRNARADAEVVLPSRQPKVSSTAQDAFPKDVPRLPFLTSLPTDATASERVFDEEDQIPAGALAAGGKKAANA